MDVHPSYVMLVCSHDTWFSSRTAHLETTTKNPEKHGQICARLDAGRPDDIDREAVLGLRRDGLEEGQVHHIPQDLRDEVVPSGRHEELRARSFNAGGIK